MVWASIGITVLHTILAVVMFFGVNWVGKHAVEFGYTSMTLFEEPNESIALNFFLRAMSPTVFIIAVSAFVVAIGKPQLRLNIFLVVPYYYILRFGVIFLIDRQGLVSWPKFVTHAAIGIGAALAAYHYLVIPNHSLLPDLKSAGNELWLAILAFLYAVANKVPAQGGPGARRRNKFVALHYARALARYGAIIDAKIEDDRLKLIVYAVLVFEDYARPPAIREIERFMFWRTSRTTGIMQVSDEIALSDEESVIRGAALLANAWDEFAQAKELWARFRATVVAYNPDADYFSRISEVMEILAKRAAPGFRAAYDDIYAS